MKVKSSVILKEALFRHKTEATGCAYICCAIADVEVSLRWQHRQEIKSNALSVFQRFKPPAVKEETKNLQGWWPKGDPQRIETLHKAIKYAESKGD